jgi:hypothetical protein
MAHSTIFPDAFLNALGAWQAGWCEEKDRRLELTARLREAIGAMPPLPEEAMRAPPTCFRKRFLVPNNAQNGGDFWPFFWDGEIAEGVASWTTNYDYCKVIFKKNPRPGTIACIFRRKPRASEVVLNIAGLWTGDDFIKAAQLYIDRRGENFQGIRHFRDTQSEVILDAPLTMDDVIAFCGRVPSLDELCTTASISAPEDEDELWRKLVEENLLPTLPYWLEGQASQAAIENAIATIRSQFQKWLRPKPAAEAT